ncbi:hypothetical protein [Streptomyces griseorubiginosus]|uniref:hypothetical protein n=1 Tax=Streptomyces griseorubiginosus TaxID=67304 RepID=UPI0036DFD184
MTKSGSDHLKRKAREIAHSTGRRFPDVLAALRRRPRAVARQPSKELVLVCNGMAHPIEGGRCARAAGHHSVDGWGRCSWGPNDAVLVRTGYYEAAWARSAAMRWKASRICVISRSWLR